MWLLYKYRLPNGKVPFDLWFDTLDENTQVRIDTRLDRLSLGNFGDTKSVGKGIYELRFFFGSGTRIYFAKTDGRIVLLLCGGAKKSRNRSGFPDSSLERLEKMLIYYSKLRFFLTFPPRLRDNLNGYEKSNQRH